MRKALRNDSTGYVPLNTETMPDFAVKHIFEYRSRARSGIRPAGGYELRKTKKPVITAPAISAAEREQMKRRLEIASL